MARFCVFCGEKPSRRNKEHVIPLWLIQLTGDPNRQAKFGYKYDDSGEVTERVFAFDQFAFPACGACNSLFSRLEDLARPIVLAVLDGHAISSRDASILLDWFDKVRVGLWLGFYQLEKHREAFAPRFFVKHRIALHDRLLIIERSESRQCLTVGGVNTRFFSFSPSAFTLTINDLHFTNVSSDFLLARRLGFPFPTQRFLIESGLVEAIMTAGNGRIFKPVLKRAIAENGVIVYQPVFRASLANPLNHGFYDCPYVIRNCLDYERGLGALVVGLSNARTTEFRNATDKFSLEPRTQPENSDYATKSRNILRWQYWLSEQTPSVDKLGAEQRKYVQKHLEIVRREISSIESLIASQNG